MMKVLWNLVEFVGNGFIQYIEWVFKVINMDDIVLNIEKAGDNPIYAYMVVILLSMFALYLMFIGGVKVLSALISSLFDDFRDYSLKRKLNDKSKKKILK